MSKTTELLTAMLNDEPIEDFTPRSRIEAYLKNCCLACGCDGLPEPITETDKLLFALTEKVAGAGGGAGELDALIDGSITELKSNAENVRQYAFYDKNGNLSNLEKVTLPNAKIVNTYAFYWNCKLKTVDLPNATELKDYAFGKCRSLETINAPKVTSIGQYGLGSSQSYMALGNVDFPLLTSLGESAFSLCGQLKEVTFPLLKMATSSAFSTCKSLTKVDFSSLVRIDTLAFESCYILTAVILRSEIVCNLVNTAAFLDCYHLLGTVNKTYNPDGLKDGYIYVPASLVDSYKTATNWTTFADQFRALEDYTVDGTITGELDPAKTGVTV